VNECGRLKRVPRRFTAKMAARHAAQLVIHERDRRSSAAASPGSRTGAGALHRARGTPDHQLVRESGRFALHILQGRFRCLLNGVAS
jgi:nicotinamidase-related amidase